MGTPSACLRCPLKCIEAKPVEVQSLVDTKVQVGGTGVVQPQKRKWQSSRATTTFHLTRRNRCNIAHTGAILRSVSKECRNVLLQKLSPADRENLRVYLLAVRAVNTRDL